MNKQFASPPGTAGTFAAPYGTYCAHDHNGPGSPAATVVPGQEGLAKNTGAPYGGIA